MKFIKACHCCGMVQKVPPIPPKHLAICVRCKSSFAVSKNLRKSASRTAATALAALILFPLAIGMPMLVIERFGHHYEASILEGCINLLNQGHIFLALIIFICSLVFPVSKLIGLLLISQGSMFFKQHHMALSYRIIENIGRWGMLDVLLVAILVAAVKLGDLVEVKPGPGAAIFSICVILSLLSTFMFDPLFIWEDFEE